MNACVPKLNILSAGKGQELYEILKNIVGHKLTDIQKKIIVRITEDKYISASFIRIFSIHFHILALE